GDSSWKASAMRRYFERLEDCRHRPFHRLLAKLGINPTRHGWKGWLRTERALPLSVVANKALAGTIVDSALEAMVEDGSYAARALWTVESGLDPNDWRLVCGNATGIRYLPLSTSSHARTGARERLLDVQRRYPDH